MMDELVIEELAVRAIQEKMDDAFRAAMPRAILTGTGAADCPEFSPDARRDSAAPPP